MPQAALRVPSVGGEHMMNTAQQALLAAQQAHKHAQQAQQAQQARLRAQQQMPVQMQQPTPRAAPAPGVTPGPGSTSRSAARGPTNRRELEHRALAKLVIASAPVPTSASLQPPQERREVLLQAHDDLVRQGQWITDLFSPDVPVEPVFVNDDVRNQLEKWRTYIDHKLGTDADNHSELTSAHRRPF